MKIAVKKIQHLFRSVGRNKAALITNIIGLSIGLATAILLVVFMLNEWSFDRHFPKADNIYRLHSVWEENGNSSVQPIDLRQAYTEIPQNIAGIDEAVQIYRGGSVEVSFNNERFIKNRLFYVDPTFFRVFDFKAVEGNIQQALQNPNTMVLTQKMAEKIFGDQQAQGKALLLNGKSYKVAAVVEDVPANTHFSFDFLMPMQSLSYLSQLGGLEFFTYFLYNPAADAGKVSQAICAANTRMLKERFSSFNYHFSSEIEPLKRLHLYSDASYDLGPRGSIKTVLLVGLITFLVMFLAVTNFVNLFIIEGEQRAKEIGVRKVNGAGKSSIVKQFFAETSLIVSLAFFTGIILAVILLPQFGNLMHRNFSIELLKSPLLLFALLSIFVLTILLSGSYPSFYLSRFNPSSILKAQSGKKGRKKLMMNLAGGLQLVVTLFLLTFLFGVNKQTHYLKNLSPGFNPSGLVNIYNLNDNIKSHYPAIRDQLLKIPEVSGVAASSHTIGAGTSGQGVRLVESSEDEIQSINEYRVQPGLCQLLQLNLKEGRFFDPERASDRNGVILNEAAKKMLGLTNAVGRQVVMFKEPMKVIGVVKDFRYESAANTIQPLVLTAYSNDMWTIMARVAQNAEMPAAIKKIEQTLKSFDSGYILSSNNTLDIYKNYYADEERLGQLTRLGAALAIVIVMMGIFMLVSQSIARRTKEIGIRKVLGGSTSKMLTLIYSNTLKWTAVASLIAIPLSYFVLYEWLQNYAVKVSLGWELFLEGVLIILVLETLITFAQTWKAANRNPVESLRYE